ncbi:MAG: hypothetical protein SGJ27_18380 [Candidatus Melainabacteria bacterium]|nr:hypothetical protein [Candidatus Melainabacteria bacterium]
MTLENQTSNGAGTDYIPASKITKSEPLTSSYVETEALRSLSLSDTTSGGTGLDKTGQGTPLLTAENYTQSLLGPSTAPWKGEAADDRPYPNELDFSAGLAFEGEFDPKFNTVPGKAKGKTEGAGETAPPTKTETPGDLPAGTTPDVAPGKTPDAAVKPAGDKPPADKPLSEKAIKDGIDAISSIGSALGFGTDQEAARITGNAEKGKKHADSQDARYVKQWRGPTDNGPIAPPKDGEDPAKYTHTNSDKSSYTVTNGKISDFTTAPTKDYPQGVKYSDIKYDGKGQIESYTNNLTPNGQTFKRSSAPDANGFANWKGFDATTNKQIENIDNGKRKPAVNAEGFHNLIGSGAFSGHMVSRQMDGSHVATKPEYRNGQMAGLETTTTLPDNTKVSQKGHFESKTNKLIHANSVVVKEADGPKTSQVKFEAGSEKGALVAAPKAEKAAPGDGMLGAIKDVLSPQSLDKLKDVKALSIQRNGPHSFHIAGDLNNVRMDPPNVSVGGFGPLGRVSATPQGGHLNKFDMNMRVGENRLDLDNIHGVHGTASLTRTRRNGSSRGIGSTQTSTTGASWDMNRNTLVAKSSQRDTNLDARHFPKDSLTGKLLSSETAEKNAKDMLHALDKNLDSASMRQVRPGVFEASVELKQKQFAIDAKIPNVKANIYTDDKINFTRSAAGVEFKPGEAQLGIQIGKGLEERKDIAKISSALDNGKPVMKIEFHGKHDPMNIPMDQAAATKPEAKLPAVKPEVAKPEVVKPESIKPTVVRPEVVQPEGAKPEGAKPEVVKPQPARVQPADKVAGKIERDVTPHQPVRDTRPRSQPSNNNACNENSGRRRFFFRRGR